MLEPNQYRDSEQMLLSIEAQLCTRRECKTFQPRRPFSVAMQKVPTVPASSFQSSTLIGRAVTRSQTSLGVRARFRLGFRAGYDVFRPY